MDDQSPEVEDAAKMNGRSKAVDDAPADFCPEQPIQSEDALTYVLCGDICQINPPSPHKLAVEMLDDVSPQAKADIVALASKRMQAALQVAGTRAAKAGAAVATTVQRLFEEEQHVSDDTLTSPTAVAHDKVEVRLASHHAMGRHLCDGTPPMRAG